MSTIHRAIGIDLGTTNSVIARMHRGEPEIIRNRNEWLTPSAVGIDKRGQLLVGQRAKRANDYNTILSIKRFMGLPYSQIREHLNRVSYQVSEGMGDEVQVHFNNRTYTPTEISAIILHYLRQAAEERLGERVSRAVITVPAYFNDAQVAATREAGRMAGFTVMRIIREPTAAALAFGLEQGLNQAETATVLVYDFGGGTFDISIMVTGDGIYDVLGIEGDKFLGGDDFDLAIVQHLARRSANGSVLSDGKMAQLALKNRAEEAKKELGGAEYVDINLPAILDGEDIENELERAQFNYLIEAHVNHTIELMHTAMIKTNMSADMIDAVLLVGGSTLVPYIQERLHQEFGELKIKRNVDPMHCVALGAAIQTSLINEIACPNPDCRDVTGRQTRNSIEAEACTHCGTSLIGYEVVTCPTCFIPTDANQTTCKKCLSPIQADELERQKITVSQQHWTCEKCKHPRNPASRDRCEICDHQRDTGGVKCTKCGHLNPPGSETCLECQALLGAIFEVIPENLGIELQDGRMAVLVYKNTAYPTPEPISQEFYTPQANQKQLEVIVRQGQSDNAEDNEYCGVILFNLPPGLPKGAAVLISFGVDDDGAIIATVQLRDFPDRRVTTQILRGGLSDPVVRKKQDDLVRSAQDLLEQSEDAAGAEDFSKRVDSFKQDGRIEDIDNFEKEVDSFRKEMESHNLVKNILFMAEITLQAAKEYLAPQQATTLEQRIARIKQALAQGQPDQAHIYAKELQQFLDEHFIYVLLAHLEAVRVGGKISAGLANRIGRGLTNLKAARNDIQIEQCIQELFACWEAVQQELGSDAPVVLKPTDVV